MSGPKFPGFRPEDFTKEYFRYPRVLEQYWHCMTGSEVLVLTFILRQIIGFKGKTEDAISLSQFVKGIGTRNKGTGLSLSQIRLVIASLVRKGFIILEKHPGRPTIFRLRYAEGFQSMDKSAPKAPPPEAKRLIELFHPVAGHRVADYLTEKIQIEAMEKLIAHYGSEEVEKYIAVLPMIQGKKFFPTITSPAELEKKLPGLVTAIKRLRNQSEESSMLL
jgi:hypothetical protein